MKVSAETRNMVLDCIQDMVEPKIHLREMLVPVDYSDGSEKAMHYARPFAELFNARITLVHVVESWASFHDAGFVPVGMSGVSVGTRGYRAFQENLKNWATRAIPADYLGNLVIRSGPVNEEICEAAEEMKTDLIIMSTHGHTGLRHAVLGSTTEKVVQHAPCPVLVVREIEHDFVD